MTLLLHLSTSFSELQVYSEKYKIHRQIHFMLDPTLKGYIKTPKIIIQHGP